jgi:hypothetical protein
MTSNKDNPHPLKWFPKVIASTNPPDKYYALEEHVVLAPFQFSTADGDARRWIWDVVFPIYNLLHMFQLVENENDENPFATSNRRLVLPMPIESHSTLDTGCHDDQTQRCDDHIRNNNQLWQLLQSPTTPSLNAKLELNNPNEPFQSNLVCAKDGVAGIGPLTLQGTKRLVQPKKGGRRRSSTNNHLGKGGLFWRFRNFCLDSLDVRDRSDSLGTTAPINITLESFLALEFGHYIHKDGEDVQLNFVDTDKHTLLDLIEVASTTHVLVASESMATFLTLFLPKGSHLIALYPRGNDTSTEDTEDKNLLSNMGHVTVHWIPMEDGKRVDNALLSELLDVLVKKMKKVAI